MALLAEIVTVADVFVDVGANRGYFAIPLPKLVGSAGQILAFEPAVDAADQLRMHARADGLLDSDSTALAIAMRRSLSPLASGWTS
jgi:FkbM family methyltransferase